MKNEDLIKQIIYHTHDKWKILILYKSHTYLFLKFMLENNPQETKLLLKDILRRIDDGESLITKGLILEFKKVMPVFVNEFCIMHSQNSSMQRFLEQKS